MHNISVSDKRTCVCVFITYSAWRALELWGHKGSKSLIWEVTLFPTESYKKAQWWNEDLIKKKYIPSDSVVISWEHPYAYAQTRDQ